MRYWFRTFLGLSALLLVCLGCNSNSPTADIGGSGTETIGGILVDTLGNPVQNAIVRVDTVSADSNSIFYLASTNSYGRYKIVTIPAGVYTLEGHTEDSSLVVYIDTINYIYAEDSLDLGVDTMRVPGRISGRVFLDSVAFPGVLVYVHGTSFNAYSDGDGNFTISNIPEGEYVISYRYTGYIEVTDTGVIVISNFTTQLKTVNLTWDINVAPPAPGYIAGTCDTAAGIVRLSWENVGLSDLSGYYIYRKNISGPNTPVKIGSATDTLFYDTVFSDLTDTNSYALRYQVTAVDTLSNESCYSPAADVIAASPTMVRTFFTWTLIPDPNDTIITGDEITLAVSFINKTRKNILLRWYTGTSPDTVRIVTLSSTEGNDTLKHIWQDMGAHLVFVEVLDEKGDTWHDSCIVTIDGIIPLNTWEEFYPLTHARRSSGVAVVDSTFYIIGGAEDLFVGVQWIQTALASLESFTAGNSSWSSFSTMPTARISATVVPVGQNLYVMGGYTTSQEYTAIEVYNTGNNVWEDPPEMNYIRFGHAACVVRDTIYVFGGIIKVDGSYTPTDSIHAFDPKSGTWISKGVMSTPRTSHQVVVLNDNVYILGGQANDPEPVKTVERYNPADNSITPVKDMLFPRMNFGAAVLQGKIYVVGGFISMSSKQFIANVEVFDPSADTWIVRKELPKPRHSFAVCAYNNTMYVIGGSDVDYPDHLGQTEAVFKYYP